MKNLLLIEYFCYYDKSLQISNIRQLSVLLACYTNNFCLNSTDSIGIRIQKN